MSYLVLIALRLCLCYNPIKSEHDRVSCDKLVKNIVVNFGLLVQVFALSLCRAC